MAIARLLVIALVTYGALFSPFTPARGRRTHIPARPTVAMALPLAAPREAAADEGQGEGVPGAIVIVIVLGAVIGVAELAVSRFKRRE